MKILQIEEKDKNLFGLTDVILSVIKYQDLTFNKKYSIEDLLKIICNNGDVKAFLDIGWFIACGLRAYYVCDFCEKYGLPCLGKDNALKIYDKVTNNEDYVFENMKIVGDYINSYLK